MVSLQCIESLHFAGHWSSTRTADCDIQTMCDAVRAEVEGYDQRTFTAFHALQYKTQTLIWTSHFIKVCAGDGEYIHVKVHRDFVRKFHLMGYQSRKSQDTPITYF